MGAKCVARRHSVSHDGVEKGATLTHVEAKHFERITNADEKRRQRTFHERRRGPGSSSFLGTAFSGYLRKENRKVIAAKRKSGRRLGSRIGVKPCGAVHTTPDQSLRPTFFVRG